MSNEAQYYHPIIQAMLQRQQLDQENERQKAAVIADKARLALEQQANVRADKQAEDLKEFHKQTLSNAHDVAQAQIEQLHNEARRQLAQDIRSGTVKPQADPFNGLQSINPYNPQESIDPRMFSNPGEASDQAASAAGKVAGAQTGASLGAAEPFEINKEARAFKTMQAKTVLEHLNKMAELAQSGVNEEHLANIHGHYAESVGAMNGRNHLLGIQITQGFDPTGDPGENTAKLENAIHQITAGNQSFTDLPPIIKKQVAQYAEKTGWTIPDKKFGDNLTSISNIQDVLNDALDYAHKYSKDKTSVVDRMEKGQLAGLVPVSDANAKLKDIASRALTVAKTFDSNNRGAQAEAQRSLAGLVDPNQTEAQNLENINSKIKSLNGLIEQRTAGMPAAQRNYALSSRGINMFGGFQDKQPVVQPQPQVQQGVALPAQGAGVPKVIPWTPNGFGTPVPLGGSQQ